MSIYCGTDIIEIERIENAIKEHESGNTNNFLNKIYTQNEIDYCESKGKMKYQHYAARFAAKEAIFKAISNLLNDKYEVTWKNVEILNDNNGRPKIVFKNISNELDNKIIDIDISLSHVKEMAIAMVVVNSK